VRLCVVPDTNVLVSDIAYPRSIPGKIVRAWKFELLDFVLSRHILAELAHSLPKMKTISLNAEEIRRLINALAIKAEIVEPETMPIGIVRDPADAPVLGTLIASGADYLITGDKDLLVLAGQYSIVTPAAFWERHGE
jgi:uncharacterized protein